MKKLLIGFLLLLLNNCTKDSSNYNVTYSPEIEVKDRCLNISDSFFRSYNTFFSSNFTNASLIENVSSRNFERTDSIKKAVYIRENDASYILFNRSSVSVTTDYILVLKDSATLIINRRSDIDVSVDTLQVQNLVIDTSSSQNIKGVLRSEDTLMKNDKKVRIKIEGSFCSPVLSLGAKNGFLPVFNQ